MFSRANDFSKSDGFSNFNCKITSSFTWGVADAVKAKNGVFVKNSFKTEIFKYAGLKS